jgi:hypothetical protein
MMMIGLIDFPWTKNKRHPGAGRDGAQGTPMGSDLDHLEIGLGNAAVRAFPIVGDIAPAGAGRDAVFRHAYIFVIDETANDALV